VTELARDLRWLCIGAGGGGDVAGAYTLLRCAGLDGVAGGITWERRAADPLAGPRTVTELRGVERVHRCAGLAGPAAAAPAGPRCSEGRLSEFLGGDQVVLVDVGEGPDQAAEGILHAARATGCDGVVLVDVGGDMLAAGTEQGLVSPLADALMLAASELLEALGLPALAAVVGPGCDGELTAPQVEERLALIDAVGGRTRTLRVLPELLDELEAAASAVGTEATMHVLRCARGERGTAWMRGTRPVALGPHGASIHLFEPGKAIASAAPLAAAVAGVDSVEAAHERLLARGAPSELGTPGRPWRCSPARVALRRDALRLM
jgi:hypothetical protein